MPSRVAPVRARRVVDAGAGCASAFGSGFGEAVTFGFGVGSVVGVGFGVGSVVGVGAGVGVVVGVGFGVGFGIPSPSVPPLALIVAVASKDWPLIVALFV